MWWATLDRSKQTAAPRVPAGGKKPELLAPAGGWEQLRYAIRYGADAVYLATDMFGMRQRAENFTVEALPQAVAYAHERGVRVHLTLNAQMYEHDFPELERRAKAAEQAGVDAVLVGDLGALDVVREFAPSVDVHVSTQASVSNARAALTWQRMGAKRIVCARELSLADIAAMRHELPPELELEVFVHGSMCMAVSGRCLLSDFMTGRSGVAGNCAQPCRWRYSLQEETRPGQYFPVEEDERGSYILNAKDLKMLEHLDDLVAAGVDSLKIEGRNKKAFYVATVVNAYRQVLDGADPADFAGELDTVSHRPYGTGFFYGPAHQTPEDDRYVREYNWALEVESCEPRPSGGFTVEGACRNRFCLDSTLEVLSPGQPMRSFQVADLEYVGAIEGRTAFEPNAEVVPGPVREAQRTLERYRLTCPFSVEPGDIMRIRREGSI